MLIRNKSHPSWTRRRRRKQSKFVTPDLALFQGKLMPFVAGPDDPLSRAERLGEEYAAMQNDHDTAVRQFLQRAYPVADQFRRRRGDFERLQVHSFFKQSGLKPRDRKRSKWVLYLLMRATTPNQRLLANKYAVILDGLRQDQVEIGAVAARIKQLGGIEAAYEAMRKPDESSTRQIRETVMPEPTKPARKSRPKRTLPLYPLVAPPFAEEKTQPYDDADENKIAWGDDAFDFVQRVAREYAEIEDGDHQAVSRVLQRAYLAVREMQRQPDEFKRLRADRFWKAPWRRPKDDSTSKWVVYFIMQTTSPNARHLATKYAEILDGLEQDQVEISEVAARIKELGGIEAAYQAMRARTTQDSQNKRTTPTALKSQQPDPPTTPTTKPTDGDRPNFGGDATGPRPGDYIDLLFGGRILLKPVGPPRPPRKLNHLDHLGINISRSKAQLQQARTKEERDYLNKKIRVLEHLLQEGQAKALARRLAARAKRRLARKR
jgi:hypothetical protein